VCFLFPEADFLDWRFKEKVRFHYFFTTFQIENISRFKKYMSISRYTKGRQWLKRQAIPAYKNFLERWLKIILDLASNRNHRCARDIFIRINITISVG